MDEVKKGLALENGGEMSLADAMIAIILMADCPMRRPGKKYEKMHNAHYKDVASSDRRFLPWIRRVRSRFPREL